MNEVSIFRRHYRRALRKQAVSDAPGLRGRLQLGKGMLGRPYAVAKQAIDAARRWGGEVESDAGVSMATQVRCLYWLGLRYRYSMKDYYRYRLFDPNRWREARFYLSWAEHNFMQTLLIERLGLSLVDELDDKVSFADWCRSNGLPTQPIVGTIGGAGGSSVARLPETDLFVKPAGARGGSGASVWRYRGCGHYEGPEGDVLAGDGLAHRFAQTTGDSLHVIQERLVVHAHLRGLSGGGLPTIRVVTGRPPLGSVVALSSAFGMPVGSSSVDNFHAGGICAAIDLASGRLSDGVRADPKECVISYGAHPDTGAQIAGIVIPAWGDVLDLAVRAHEAASGVPFVGWDIVVTDDGPLLLEANPSWDAAMPQIPLGQPLGKSPYVSWFLQHLEGSGTAQPSRW